MCFKLTLNHCIQHQNVEQIPEGFDFLEGQLLNPVESQLITKRINKINQRALRDELQEHHDFHEDGITYIALDTQEQNNIRYKWRMASEGERQEQEPEAGNNRLNNNHKMFLDKLRLLLEQETSKKAKNKPISITLRRNSGDGKTTCS